MQVPNDEDPNWYLEKVTVQDSKPGSDSATFSYGDWLDTEKTSADVSRWQSQIKYRWGIAG